MEDKKLNKYDDLKFTIEKISQQYLDYFNL